MSTSRVLTLVLLQLLVNIIFGIGGSGEADLKTRSISLSANNVAVLDGATIPWPTTIGAPDEDGHPINVPVRTTGESMLPAATQFSDDRIVLAVRELIMTVNELVTASCVGDLNRTFAALERREAWAITSKLCGLFTDVDKCCGAEAWHLMRFCCGVFAVKDDECI